MSYVILFQPEKGDRRHRYDDETYDTKEAVERLKKARERQKPHVDAEDWN